MAKKTKTSQKKPSRPVQRAVAQAPRRRVRRRRRNADLAMPLAIERMDNRLVHHALQATPMQSTQAAKPTTSKVVDCFPAFDEFVRAMSHPFRHPPAKCPMSYNPAPTFRTNVGRTTVTISNWPVSASTTYTFNVLPGWCQPQAWERSLITPPPAGFAMQRVVDVQPVANICGPVRDFALNQYCTSPFVLTAPHDGTPIAGCCVFGGVAKNGADATVPGNINFYNREGWDWDAVLPYTGVAGDGNSLRWRCTGIAVRVVNTTPGLTRGGSVWSVQPTYDVTEISNWNESVPIGTMAREPSLMDWGVCDKPKEISAVLKPKDLSYWSSFPPGPVAEGGYYGTAFTQNPALCLVLDAGASTQTYNLQFEFHWEFAGNALQTILTPGVHLPEVKNAFEPAVAEAINTAPTAEHVGALAKVMEHVNAGTVSKALSHPVIKDAVKSAAGSAVVGGLLTKMGVTLPRIVNQAASVVSGLL